MSDVKLPTLGQSASATAVGPHAGNASAGMQRASSQGDVRKKNAQLPDLVAIRFQPGRIGLAVDGTLVTRSASSAWMRGVRPGWSVRMVAGQQVEETDGAEDLLQKAENGAQRYEIHFQKGKSKFGIGSEEVSKEELMRQENRKLLRRTFQFQAHIDRVEHRGITLQQLERVHHFAEEWCTIWKDMAPPKVSKTSGQRLRMEILNLNHMHSWMIMPATEKKKCAFVELVASARQVPAWFVCHYWGEPIAEFMECLKAHVKARRSATEESPYWICAYACRQHTNEAEVFEKIETSAFYKAMQATRFRVLLVVDRQATAFSRMWCGLEETALLDQKRTDMDIASYSVYPGQPRAHILTHGLTEDEKELEDANPGAGVRQKALREAEFPLEVAEFGITSDLHKGETTNDEDRIRILNVIAGTDLQKDPPAEHENYFKVSRRLQSLFATLLLFRGTAARSARAKERTSTLTSRISLALRADQWRKALDMSLEGFNTEGMELLAQSIPPNLQELKLRLRNSTITDEDLEALAEGIADKPLKSVSLDLMNCKGISEKGRAAFAGVCEASATKPAVDLELANTEALQYIMECEQPKKDMVTALGVSFFLDEEELAKYPHDRVAAVPAVPALIKALTTEPKPHARVAAVRALASFGEHAQKAVPTLEQVKVEDTEVSVQQAAIRALAKISGQEAKAE